MRLKNQKHELIPGAENAGWKLTGAVIWQFFRHLLIPCFHGVHYDYVIQEAGIQYIVKSNNTDDKKCLYKFYGLKFDLKDEMQMKRLIMILVLFATLNVFAEDMVKYLKDTVQLAQDGKNEEALKRFIWLYDHALEHNPAFYGPRLSYLLGYWKELGDKYPPALKALQDVRDKETELLKNGKGTYETFNEVKAINRVLMEEKKSIELFVFLDNKYPELAKECWDCIESEIIAAKKFDLARKYLLDPAKKFNEIVLTYKTNVLRYESRDVDYKKINEDNFVQEVLYLITTTTEVVKNKKMAEEIRRKAFEILSDPRLK